MKSLLLHLCTVLLFLFQKTLTSAESLTIKLFGGCTKAKSGAAMAAARLDAILDLTLRKDLTHANWSGFRVHPSAFSQRNLVLDF